MTVEEQKERAAASAERLSEMIRTGFPSDRVIGREWHVLWEAMTQAYGSELFETGQDARFDCGTDRN